MAHFLFNFTHWSGEEANAFLDAKMWGIGYGEPHRDELSSGDTALVYVASAGTLIGRAEVATTVHEWDAVGVRRVSGRCGERRVVVGCGGMGPGRADGRCCAADRPDRIEPDRCRGQP